MRGQCCRRGFSARADQNVLYSPTSVQYQSDGTADLVCELCEGFCGFKREDLIHGHTSSRQSLKHRQLAGAETENLSVNFWNGRRFLMSLVRWPLHQIKPARLGHRCLGVHGALHAELASPLPRSSRRYLYSRPVGEG